MSCRSEVQNSLHEMDFGHYWNFDFIDIWKKDIKSISFTCYNSLWLLYFVSHYLSGWYLITDFSNMAEVFIFIARSRWAQADQGAGQERHRNDFKILLEWYQTVNQGASIFFPNVYNKITYLPIIHSTNQKFIFSWIWLTWKIVFSTSRMFRPANQV